MIDFLCHLPVFLLDAWGAESILRFAKDQHQKAIYW